METTSTSRFSEIEVLFRQYSNKICSYIKSRINSEEDAENLSQDVWMRIMESDATLCKETAVSYLYRIASNLVNDYLRNLYTRMGVTEDIKKNQANYSNHTPDQDLCVKQITELEAKRIECLPRQRRIIYTMSRFEEKSVADIAGQLSLSFRTVENHLRMGRHDVRTFINAIA